MTPPRRPHAGPDLPAHARRRPDGGFTLVEVLVAATLLVVGLLASASLLDNGVRATHASQQQDAANALAQEVAERAAGGRYTTGRNDLTDVDPTATAELAGPADRMRLALDPDRDQQSGTVRPATVRGAAGPSREPQTWSVRRRGTTYDVTYRACTASDTVRGVRIAGPYDCDRPALDPTGGDQATVGDCRIGVTLGGTLEPSDPTRLTVRVQLLGILGVEVCVGALSPFLADALCRLLGTSGALQNVAGALLGPNGPVNGLLGGLLGSSATATLCPVSQVEEGITGSVDAIASSTRVTVGVSWTDPGGRLRRVVRTSVVRRAAT